MADALRLAVAAAEVNTAPAILADGIAVSYGELHARCLVAADPPRVLRAPVTLATIEAIHTALLRGRWFAPLHPAAPHHAELRLEQRLATIDVLASTAVLVSTSGSTGEPKLVELSSAALASHARAANVHLGVRGDDRWLLALPLAHTGGLSSLVRCLVARAALVLAQPPALSDGFAAWLVDRTRALAITRWSLVPAQLQGLVAGRLAVPPSLRSVLLGGQAVAPALLHAALVQGWPIVVSYGLTETCGVCVATRIGEDAGASVGRALPGVELRVIDEQLELRGPMVAARVHGAPPPRDDGWLRTADRARLADDGSVTILGRADDVITSGGHKIDPLEVEAALRAAPQVHGAVVVGVPDERFGTKVVALVALERAVDETIAREAIVSALASSIARYKHPRELYFTDALPLLPSGKVDRAAAAARCVTREPQR